MKRFIKPDMVISKFDNESVAVTESGVIPETPVDPTTPTVWGNSIGTIDFSNFQF